MQIQLPDRGRVKPGLGLVLGVAIGAAAMYFLHPTKGEKRRKRVAGGSRLAFEFGRRALSAQMKARVAAQRERELPRDPEPDPLRHEDAVGRMLDTVRRELERVLGRSRAVQALMEDGRLVLRGSVSDREVDAVMGAVRGL